MVRNISAIRVPHRILIQQGRFRVAQFDAPFFSGNEFWVVNEKGFLWEPADNLELAKAYLESPEAKEYQQT